MSNLPYFEDSSQHGNYQYVLLSQIIDDYMANLDPDDYTSTTLRHRVLYNAMRGVRELYYDVMQEIRAVELDLGPTLTVTLPPDYVNYVRISWVDEAGKLHPMTADNSSNIARDYLQDHEYNFLLDGNGCVTMGTGTRPQPYGSIDLAEQKEYKLASGYTPNVNLSNFHKNGSFRLDKQNGLIQFDSNAESKTIVIEYISDGLFSDTCGGGEGEIKVHKFAEQALIDWIYYSLIKQRRNVPANEKMRARKEYYNSRRIAGRRINTLRKEELIQAMSGSTMNIEPSN
jgi:hypothetical protein